MHFDNLVDKWPDLVISAIDSKVKIDLNANFSNLANLHPHKFVGAGSILVDIDLLTRYVFMAETSRLTAANEFRKMIKM